MRRLGLKPSIFRKFPMVRTFFVAGQPEPTLQRLRKKFVVASMRQVHGRKSAAVNQKRSRVYSVDALYTDKFGIFLAVRTSDCLPVLFYNRKAGVVGVVHAGWKGTQKKILEKTVNAVARKFHALPKDFYFYFGPAARACCYSVPEHDRRLKLFSKHFLKGRNGGVFLDFVSANRQQLLALGVPKTHIEDSGLCTIHNHEYPSHRREGQGRKETLLSLIGQIKKPLAEARAGANGE